MSFITFYMFCGSARSRHPTSNQIQGGPIVPDLTSLFILLLAFEHLRTVFI